VELPLQQRELLLQEPQQLAPQRLVPQQLELLQQLALHKQIRQHKKQWIIESELN